MIERARAASATVRANGPTVSWLWEMGTTPDRLVRPTVGLMPTTPHMAPGHSIDPSVSVPIESGAKPAATAAAEPELDPQGDRSRAYGLRHCPPRALQPLVDRVDRILAHSLMLALPKMTAPASRSRRATSASRLGRRSSR